MKTSTKLLGALAWILFLDKTDVRLPRRQTGYPMYAKRGPKYTYRTYRGIHYLVFFVVAIGLMLSFGAYVFAVGMAILGVGLLAWSVRRTINVLDSAEFQAYLVENTSKN
jgi:hypothetical protein